MKINFTMNINVVRAIVVLAAWRSKKARCLTPKRPLPLFNPMRFYCVVVVWKQILNWNCDKHIY